MKAEEKIVAFMFFSVVTQFVYSLEKNRIWGWGRGLVGCFGLNGPLRQYFSLYRAVFQREGERIEKL